MYGLEAVQQNNHTGAYRVHAANDGEVGVGVVSGCDQEATALGDR